MTARKAWWRRRLHLQRVGSYRGLDLYAKRGNPTIIWVARGYVGRKSVEITSHPGLGSTKTAERVIDKWITRFTGVTYPTRKRP